MNKTMLEAACRRFTREWPRFLRKIEVDASFLDAQTIKFINEVPGEIALALAPRTPSIDEIDEPDEDFEPERELCEWIWDEIHCKWDTSCNHAWCMIEGGLDENNVNFCPMCGLFIHEKGKGTEEL